MLASICFLKILISTFFFFFIFTSFTITTYCFAAFCLHEIKYVMMMMMTMMMMIILDERYVSARLLRLLFVCDTHLASILHIHRVSFLEVNDLLTFVSNKQRELRDTKSKKLDSRETRRCRRINSATPLSIFTFHFTFTFVAPHIVHNFGVGFCHIP